MTHLTRLRTGGGGGGGGREQRLFEVAPHALREPPGTRCESEPESGWDWGACAIGPGQTAANTGP
jgi:hypothetical protein